MNKELLAIFLLVALAFPNGCGTTAKAQARNYIENYRAAYEKCLQQYPYDPFKCEGLKRAFEADLEAYREASKGMSPSLTGFIEFGPESSRK
jgi:hypothetical protein